MAASVVVLEAPPAAVDSALDGRVEAPPAKGNSEAVRVADPARVAKLVAKAAADNSPMRIDRTPVRKCSSFSGGGIFSR